MLGGVRGESFAECGVLVQDGFSILISLGDRRAGLADSRRMGLHCVLGVRIIGVARESYTDG